AVIASTTRSQLLRSSSRVVPVIRLSRSSFAFTSILPRATRSSSVFRRLPRPRWSNSSLASTTVVATPAWAETCAMPDPMSPQPRTPTLAMGIDPPSGRAPGRPSPRAAVGFVWLVADATARQRGRLVVRRPGRAGILHGHADAAVANAAIFLDDTGRTTRSRAFLFQGLVEGGLPALDRR